MPTELTCITPHSDGYTAYRSRRIGQARASSWGRPAEPMDLTGDRLIGIPARWLQAEPRRCTKNASSRDRRPAADRTRSRRFVATPTAMLEPPVAGRARPSRAGRGFKPLPPSIAGRGRPERRDGRCDRLQVPAQRRLGHRGRRSPTCWPCRTRWWSSGWPTSSGSNSCGYVGGANMGDFTYTLTDAGRDRARRYMEESMYVGAAPVPLDAYCAGGQGPVDHPREARTRTSFARRSATC